MRDAATWTSAALGVCLFRATDRLVDCQDTGETSAHGEVDGIEARRTRVSAVLDPDPRARVVDHDAPRPHSVSCELAQANCWVLPTMLDFTTVTTIV
jgi:hypothetical protein